MCGLPSLCPQNPFDALLLVLNFLWDDSNATILGKFLVYESFNQTIFKSGVAEHANLFQPSSVLSVVSL